MDSWIGQMAWVGGWGCARACVCACVCACVGAGPCPILTLLLLARVFRLQSLFGKPADLLEKDSDQNDTCKTANVQTPALFAAICGVGGPHAWLIVPGWVCLCVHMHCGTPHRHDFRPGYDCEQVCVASQRARYVPRVMYTPGLCGRASVVRNFGPVRGFRLRGMPYAGARRVKSFLVLGLPSLRARLCFASGDLPHHPE